MHLVFDLTNNLMIFGILLTLGLNIMALVIYKYRFLNIYPVAIQLLMNQMSEAFIVLDRENRITNFNHSFQQIFPQIGMKDLDKDIRNIISVILDSNEIEEDTKNLKMVLEDSSLIDFNGEICLVKPQKHYYIIRVNPVMEGRKRDKLLGRIVTMIDITKRKELLSTLQKKNNEIEEINHKVEAMNEELIAGNRHLYEYAQILENLAISRERLRFASEVHDALGHTLILVLTLLQVAKKEAAINPVEARIKLSEAVSIARNGFNEVKKSVVGSNKETSNGVFLSDIMEALAQDFRNSGIEVELSLENVIRPVSFQLAQEVMKLGKEAMTNSVRHGRADKIQVILKLVHGVIKLFVFDNGQGCKQIKPGFGLNGMKRRVEELGGNISFGSDGTHGFHVHLEIPLGEMEGDTIAVLS